jgi:hypothetical protein
MDQKEKTSEPPPVRRLACPVNNVATAEQFWVDLFEYQHLRPGLVTERCFLETASPPRINRTLSSSFDEKLKAEEYVFKSSDHPMGSWLPQKRLG